ncbi:MAG: hypothetical protein NDJ89_08405 [Oligoflexia bacterium]|nr:hypothetical protein [Oligoflexia bacterium]
MGALVSIALVSFFALAAGTFQINSRQAIHKQEALALRNNEYAQFYRLLSQPSYVGSLANSSENQALSRCIRTDGALCSTSEEFPLTALDLATEKPITVLNPEAQAQVTSSLSFQVHCPGNASSCDAADYLVIKIKSSIKAANGTAYTTEKALTVKPAASNHIDLVPNTVVENGRPINLVIFLDGSGSMFPIKDSIKAALQDLLNKISTMDVNLAIYGIQYGAEGKIVATYIIDPATGAQLPVPTPLGDQPDDFVWYVDKVTNPYYGSLGIDRFAFSTSDTADQRSTKLSALQMKIDTIFSNGAVQSLFFKDSSLCHMLRILSDAAAPIAIDSTTPTVFMTITNEADESAFPSNASEMPSYFNSDFPATCVQGHTEKWVLDGRQRWYAYGDAYTPFISVKTFYTIDGAPVELTRYLNPTPSYLDAISAGLSGDISDCTAKMTNPLMKPSIESILKALKWDPAYPYTVTSCGDRLGNINQGTYYTPPPDGDYCLTAEASLLLDKRYIPNSCKTKVDRVSSGTTAVAKTLSLHESPTSPRLLVPEDAEAHATHDLPLAIVNALKKKVDMANSFYLPIIMPSSGACPLTPGSSYGTTYEALAARFGANASVTPICGSDFTSKFSKISNFLATLGANDLTLPPAVIGNMTGVEVVRGATILQPIEGKDYVISGNLLIFTPGYLLPAGPDSTGDIVRIYLK